LPTNTPDDSTDWMSREVERRATAQRLDVFLSSREVGYTLASDALDHGQSADRLIDLAGGLADYADAAIDIVREEYRPALDCREGCSYCCCKPGVLISVPELLRIVDHVQNTFTADAINAVRDKARAYVQQLDGRSFDALTNESFPCPLLSGGRCSVYQIRPLTCRGYNSTSVDACRQAFDSTGCLVPIFSVIKDVTDATTVGAATRLREIGADDALVDLGTALDIALAADRRFADRVAGGEPLLLAAHNVSWVDDVWTRVRETATELGVEAE
jgi:Fe-S-cluster containining protein